MYNKKAQLGETMTWIVATLIIIIVLAISISVTSLNSGKKKIIIFEKSDLYAVKSVSAYMLTNDFYHELSEGDFNKKNGDFAFNLFTRLFSGVYPSGIGRGIWFGFVSGKYKDSNDYFGKRLDPPAGFGEGTIGVRYINEEFKLREKEMELIFAK